MRDGIDISSSGGFESLLVDLTFAFTSAPIGVDPQAGRHAEGLGSLLRNRSPRPGQCASLTLGTDRLRGIIDQGLMKALMTCRLSKQKNRLTLTSYAAH
jgi:hypothetical protein